MAKPTGAITVATVYYDIWDDTNTGNGRQDLYYIIKTPRMHQEFETNNVSGQLMSFDIWRQAFISNSGSLDEYWLVGETSKMALTDVPHTWTTSTLGYDSQVQNPTGTPINRVPEERYVLAKQSVYNALEDGDVELLMVGFFAKNDTAYSGPGVELVKRSANRVYAADYPCSAWHVMSVLAETHKKILYENKPAFSIPVFGDLTPAAPPP